MWIETQRLTIRDLRAEDQLSFAEMAADGSLKDIGFDKGCGRWMGKWMAEAAALAAGDNPQKDYLAYTVALKGENVAVGSVGCSYYEDLRQTGITYFIGAPYRNNGYAAEAVKAYTRYFFRHYPIRKMIAAVREENLPSQKVAEKAGFIWREKRMYRDINDDKEERYVFYEITG